MKRRMGKLSTISLIHGIFLQTKSFARDSFIRKCEPGFVILFCCFRHHNTQVVLIRLFTADEAHSSVPVNLSFTCQRWFDRNKNGGLTTRSFSADEVFQPGSTKKITSGSGASTPSEVYYSASSSPRCVIVKEGDPSTGLEDYIMFLCEEYICNAVLFLVLI